jgi:glycosyltransferase involved in cell wall biosynthesis
MRGELPKISIVTPSYNQGAFIEETIRSVLDQNYPNLEYIVMDGGSTDGTLEILHKYDGRIRWSSEKDHGQTDAINKGMGMASGEIRAYLNSDDLYQPGALLKVGQFFRDHPEAMWLSGRCQTIDAVGKEIRRPFTAYKHFWLGLHSYHVLLVLNYVAQPATFWRRAAAERIGPLNETLFYTMDYEYWLRLGAHYPLHALPEPVARFRVHTTSKSGNTVHLQFDEELAVAGQFGQGLVTRLHRLHRNLTVAIYRRRPEFNSIRTSQSN